MRGKYRNLADQRVRNFVSCLDIFWAKAADHRATQDPAGNTGLRKLEDMVNTDKAKAIALAAGLLRDEPELFDSPEAYESDAIFLWAGWVAERPPSDVEQELKKALSGFTAVREQYSEFKKHCDEAIAVLMATADQRPMANYIAQAISSMPSCVEKPYFYEHADIVSGAKEIYMKLQGLGLKGIAA